MAVYRVERERKLWSSIKESGQGYYVWYFDIISREQQHEKCKFQFTVIPSQWWTNSINLYKSDRLFIYFHHS